MSPYLLSQNGNNSNDESYSLIECPVAVMACLIDSSEATGSPESGESIVTILDSISTSTWPLDRPLQSLQ
jgi:hypothetical protein